MTTRRGSLVLVIACLSVSLGAGADPQPELARLKAHVETLASPEFGGRSGAGARKAEAYVTDAFKALKLKPLFDGSFTQIIPGKEPGEIAGRNVGAMIEGSDPALKDQWVILSAHYDHLGVRDGVLYPGADDNASSIAMMLETARSLVEGRTPPKRSIAFIAFDLEENGLWGSRYFTQHPPIPLENIALFMTADLLGRSLGGVGGSFVFVIGSETSPGLRPTVETASKGEPIRVGLLGADLLVIDRSDYGPFRARKIPYLFFSCGESPQYHSPRDVPETLDYPKLEAISRMIARIVQSETSDVERPSWEPEATPRIEEALTIRELMRMLLDHKDELKIKPAVVVLMNRTLAQLDAIAERGAITPAERRVMVRAAQIVLFTVL
jgi:hypothetical protein